MPCKYCVLCGNRDQSTSYYSFPKKEDVRKEWLAFCEINENVLNTVTKLCEHHFNEQEIIRKAKGSCLKPNAVPMYKKKRKIHQQLFPSSEGCNSIKKTNIAITDVKVKGNVSDEDTSMAVNKCIPQTPPRSLKVLNSLATPLNDKDAHCSSNNRTPPKIVYEPCYVNEIGTPYLSTLRKERRTLALAKRTISLQRKKIRTLQRSHYRLITRITTLKDLVKHLLLL